MSTSDPWNWSVDDLVRNLCTSRAVFDLVGCDAEFYPDVGNLEQQLRLQRVTGQVFLTALNPQTLRYDLGIATLGERLALSSVMKLLRDQSALYQQHTATAGVKSLTIQSDRPSESTGIAASDENGRKRARAVPVTDVPPSTAQSNQPRVAGSQMKIIQPANTAQAPGDWDHLMRWASVGAADEEISGDEEEDSAGEELVDADDYNGLVGAAEEDAQDVEDEGIDRDIGGKARGSKLSQDQIVDIINEVIEKYTNAWMPGKDEITIGLEPEELAGRYDADRLWEKAQAEGKREQLVRHYGSQAEYFQQRLDELCDEILKVPGTNADAVRLQCRNLEVTVDSLELANWYASIYSLEPEDDSEEDDTDSEEIVDIDPPQVSRPDAFAEIIDLDTPPSTSGLPDNHFTPTQSLSLHHTYPKATPIAIRSTVEVDHDAIAASAGPAQALLGDTPENASIATVRRWEWKDLVDTQDRKRVVSKAVYEMSPENREMIRSRLQFVGRMNMVREIPACIAMLIRGDQRMQGVLPRDTPKIVAFTTLFLCWWLCDNYFKETPSKWNLEELARCLEGDSPDPTTFCDYLNTIMVTTFSTDAMQHPERPSQAEVITISDDEDEAPRPVKRRKSSMTIVLD